MTIGSEARQQPKTADSRAARSAESIGAVHMAESGKTDAVVSRREAMGVLGAAAAIPAAAGVAAAQPADARENPEALRVVRVSHRINGIVRTAEVDTRTSLLDHVRTLGLVGTKKGCDQGQCGACTVHLNGERTLSCLTLAVACQGQAVTTIEGLADDKGPLHPMQQAFIDNDAFQCGYCTPGQIMSAVACVAEGHARTDDDIREYMSGNLCRCSAYPNIVAAVRQAATQMRRA